MHKTRKELWTWIPDPPADASTQATTGVWSADLPKREHLHDRLSNWFFFFFFVFFFCLCNTFSFTYCWRGELAHAQDAVEVEARDGHGEHGPPDSGLHDGSRARATGSRSKDIETAGSSGERVAGSPDRRQEPTPVAVPEEAACPAGDHRGTSGSNPQGDGPFGGGVDVRSAPTLARPPARSPIRSQLPG